MKKILLVFALVVITVSASHAQHVQQADSYEAVSWRERPMRVGASMSGNVSMMAGMDWGRDIYLPNVGGGGGVSFNVPIAKMFNFNIELNYQLLNMIPGDISVDASSLRIAKLPYLSNIFNSYNNISHIKLITQYISIPMLFQFLPKSQGNFFINFGPELKVCLYSHSRYGRYNDNQMEYINRAVLAFNVGVGMHVPIAERWDFVWETRFAFDITNPRKESEPFFVAGANTLVLSLHAGVVYRF